MKALRACAFCYRSSPDSAILLILACECVRVCVHAFVRMEWVPGCSPIHSDIIGRTDKPSYKYTFFVCVGASKNKTGTQNELISTDSIALPVRSFLYIVVIFRNPTVMM